MANLNLSEFTEKLFVADADHTFIWDTQNAISKRVSRNSWLNSGTLTSDAPVTISQTWNAGSNVMTALRLNVTDTVSGGTSSLFDARTTAGGSQFSVQKGVVVGDNYSSSTTYGVKTPFVSFGGYYGSGALCGSVNGLTLFATPTVNAYISIGAAIATIGNTNSALAIGAAADTILVRDGAANTLALRNGGAAQTFNVYGTSSSNNTVYERMFMRYSQSALAFQVGTEQLGATSRPLEFFTNGTRKFAIAGSGINTSTFYGHDNTNSTILILRTLSGTAKGQFYVNPSGNCEFGLGFPVAGFPILLSESGNSYFNGGNVGIGTTSPTSKLDVAGAVTAAGYYTATSGGVSLVANGLWQQGTGHLTLASGAILGWSGQANVNIDQPGDTRLQRDEAYHLALRNGTNGQKFSVYGTYPGAAWERFTITAPTSGNVLLGTYKGTGGIARGLEFQTDGVTRMTIGAAGDISVVGGIVANNASVGGAVGISLGAAVGVNWAGNKNAITGGTTDGVVCISNYFVNDFNRLQIGGTTSSFPAIKRVGTEFQIVIASTTAAINVAAPDADLTFIEDRYRRKGAGTPEGVVTAPIGAVYHNTTGGAGTSFYVKESGTGNTGWVGK